MTGRHIPLATLSPLPGKFKSCCIWPDQGDTKMGARHVWVMVLGDVGRSPRMQYHTLSLCKTVSDAEISLPSRIYATPCQAL